MTEDDSNSPTYELDDAYKRNLLEQKREAEPLPSKVMVLADKRRPGLFVGYVRNAPLATVLPKKVLL